MSNKLFAKIIMIVILTMLLACNFVLAANDLDRDKQLLFGPVKKVTSYTNSHIPTITTWMFREDGSIENLQLKMFTASIIFYDYNGREIRSEEITADGKKVISSTLYDDENHKYTIYYHKKGYPEAVSGTLDKNGQIIDYYEYDLNGVYLGKTISSYDEAGLLVEANYYDQDGKHFLKSARSYNSDGRIVSIISYDRKGLISDKVEHVYDPKGRCVETLVYKQMYNNPSECVLASKSQYVLDEADRQIETLNYQYESSGESKTVFRYADFDKYGNWQRRVTEDKGVGAENNNQSVMTRTIEYY
ncbi:MAG: hypothetical protein H6Q67_1663 [Firmicutes bacterium]|nr:hypothetical protein [Bacillota bacterium]